MSQSLCHLKRSSAILLALAALSACAPQKFDPVDGGVGLDNPLSDEISSNFFKIADSTATFQQESTAQNKTSLSFEVKLSDGSFVNNLQSGDISITENGKPVSQFQFSSNSQNIVQTVDIVFAVDVTGSMSPTIESAKTRLINFVNTSRAKGFHTRMCLVTFGDYTVQKCNKFYDNDPADPATQSQVQELISEISKLKALVGDEDPGGEDFNENPMRALIDSSKAPFATNSQRFLILITDDGFLYSPGNQGSVGAGAPKWSEVSAALASSQMKVFAVTPSLAGYNKPFQGNPGIVDASGGEFFLFADLISGKISLDTVLAGILNRVRTTYLVEYNADEIPGLDPSLPMSQRHITVTLANGVSGSLVPVSQQSTMPEGNPVLKKEWALTDKKILNNKVRVRINGFELPFGFSVSLGKLIFELPPVRGAKIEVIFQYADIKDALQFSAILLNKSIDLNSIEIWFNGQKAKGPDVTFERTLEGQWTVRPSERVLSNDDPFGIRAKGGLAIRINKIKAAE